MPTVPTIQTPQKRAGFTPSGAVDNSILSRGIGMQQQANQQLAGTLSNRFQDIQKKMDVAKATSALYDFNDEARTKMFEIQNTKGGDAVGVTDSYRQWYDQRLNEVSENLSNNQQRMFLKNSALQRRQSDLDKISSYEAGEHQRYLGSLSTATQDQAMQDALLPYTTPEDIEKSSRDAGMWIDVANPGMDNSDKKRIFDVNLKKAHIESLTNTDPTRAKVMLERWRVDLGPNYTQISKEVNKEYLYQKAVGGFPDNFNMQYDWVKNVKNVDEDVKRAVMGRINSDEAEAEGRERDTLAKHEKLVKSNNLDAWVNFATGNMSMDILIRLARTQQIDTATFNGIRNEMRNPTENNNPVVVGEIAEALAMGQDVDQALDDALRARQIKTETFVSFKTQTAQAGYKTALNYITNAIKPSDFYYNPDKSLKFAEAILSFQNRVGAGEDPAVVAQEIVKNNTANITRTSRGLAIPTYLKGDAEATGNMLQLQSAEMDTVQAYQAGKLSDDEYRYQMDLIGNHIRIAREMQQSASVDNTELQKQIQKQRQNQN